MAQLLRSTALGAPQRITEPIPAFQASKLLSTRAAPQRTTPFVRSSSSSRTARPLSQPLRGAPDGNPASPSPSPWAEARRRLIRSVGRRLLAIAAVGIFCTVYPPPLFDTPLLHILVAVFLCDLVMGD